MREFTSLEAGLSLMPGLPPDEVARLLDQRVERLRIEIGSVEAAHAVARERALPELFLVESMYRQAMLSAELAFVTDLVAGIRTGSFAGTKAWRRMHELRADGVTLEQMFADPVGHLGEEARALLPPDHQPPDHHK